MKILIKDLDKIITKILRKKYDTEDTNRMKDLILFGELSGKTSHGIVRLIIGDSCIMAQNPQGKPAIIHKTKLSSIIEGNNNPGMLVGSIAMNEVVRIAKLNGFGLVGTKQSNSSSGCISYYLEKIAKENFIAIIMAQSPKSTIAYGGIEPLFGTNPISFGIPSQPRPIIFDMATAAISFGAMLKTKELGLKLPNNVAIDMNGNPTTDPTQAMNGATLAFDNSYKGSGLAMMVEILAGLWPGADFVGMHPEGGWGNIFMAFSPDLLINIENFKQKTKELIERIKLSKTKDGNKIRVPGEYTLDTRDKHLKESMIDVEDILYHELKKAALN